MSFLGYSTGGLGELFDEEEARRVKAQHSYESRQRDRARGKATPHEVECVVCGEVVWTTSNTQRTCGKECSKVYRASQERRRVIAEKSALKARLAFDYQKSAAAVRGKKSSGDAANDHSESSLRPPRRPAMAAKQKRPRR